MSTITDQTREDELRLRLRGDLYSPGEPGYEDACSLFNSMIERRPALVARCSAPDDVIAALAFGHENGLDVAVRGGGHSVAGHCLSDGGLVLDVRGMNEVEVDPVRRVARVGGGAVWSEVDRATQAHGLATTGGRVSSTGVAGLTFGGGSGWLERKHGLTCDNLEAIELVTADGQMVRASETENPELLWAHRGGGGNFGVVTAVELRLHRLGPEVLAGMVVHPAERGRELLRLYRDTMIDAPEALSLAFMWMTAPADPEIPAELHGEPVVLIPGMYAGSVDEGERALAALRSFGPPAADLFEPMPYADFQCALDDPPGYRNYWTAENLRAMPDDAVDAIVDHSERMPAGGTRLPQLFICAWGGAVARPPADSSPLGGRDSAFVVHPLFLWEDAADDEAMIASARGYRDALRLFASGDAYGNFIGDEGEGRTRAGFTPAETDRLARIKAAWDPENRFHGNQNIRPATAG
jgi:FAD/FMN-containing dehydrogenase